MHFKQLIIYKFCTLGGVEKCLLDRAFLYKNLPITCFVCFLSAKKEMLDVFQNYIIENNLEQHLKVISVDQIKDFHFDRISAIDTPEVLQWFPKINVECHSSYAVSRTYLNKLPNTVDKIIVPSQPFADFIQKEHSLKQNKLMVLPNFIIKKQPVTYLQKIWNKKIIFYFGRLDHLKNYHELLKIFALINSKSDEFLFYILSPSLVELNQIFASYKKLRGKLILKTGLCFSKIHIFLQLMKLHQGIFVSSSKAESFGLASAEALVEGIPVVLADNPVHRYLVQNKPEFLYTLGDPQEAANKIFYLANHYQQHCPSSHFLTEVLAKQHLEKMECFFDNEQQRLFKPFQDHDKISLKAYEKV